jgi:quercetin dioxygenase-like cupin family protein
MARRIGAAAAVAVAILSVGIGLAQQPGFTRTELQRSDLSVPGREVVTVKIDFAPGGGVGRHTHFGEEVTYVIDGTVVLEIDGKEPRVMRAGEVAVIPAGVVHAAHVPEGAPAHALANYIVEKGKPLATPVK